MITEQSRQFLFNVTKHVKTSANKNNWNVLHESALVETLWGFEFDRAFKHFISNAY